jgi:hypothetical protein
MRYIVLKYNDTANVPLIDHELEAHGPYATRYDAVLAASLGDWHYYQIMPLVSDGFSA